MVKKLLSMTVLGEQNSEGGEGAAPGNHLGIINYWYLACPMNSKKASMTRLSN